ncbi:MAG: NDP-sugar synthase [Muribaculaceae bacterium]|nr:NDP-sugar synthase [Muribaculaceae bacterium]
MDYVILAGGLGSRFVKEGYEVPKPLVPLFGRPMIGVLIDTLMRTDAGRIYVGANARMPQLLEYLDSLRGEGLPVETRPIVTDNSFCTLKAASEGIEGKFVAMTCDAIFPADEFRAYVEAVKAAPADEALMGLTRFVEDESPLYARISEGGEVIDYRYGGVPFEGDVIVSAGLYGLSGRIMDEVPRLGLHPESLSDFQRLLATSSPVRVMPYEFSVAFDVDNGNDRVHAEEFLRECR